MSNPWDDLEPEAPRVERVSTEPAAPKPPKGPGGAAVFLRGATKRCPRCGSGGLFRSWFRIRDRCPKCGLRLEREEGGSFAALRITYMLPGAVGGRLLLVWFVVAFPALTLA